MGYVNGSYLLNFGGEKRKQFRNLTVTATIESAHAIRHGPQCRDGDSDGMASRRAQQLQRLAGRRTSEHTQDNEPRIGQIKGDVYHCGGQCYIVLKAYVEVCGIKVSSVTGLVIGTEDVRSTVAPISRSFCHDVSMWVCVGVC